MLKLLRQKLSSIFGGKPEKASSFSISKPKMQEGKIVEIETETVTDIEELVKQFPADSNLAHALRQIANAIPINAEQKPIDNDRIQIDSAALIVLLTSNGYEPIQVLLLLCRIYGSIMASAPDTIGNDENGNVMTPDKVEEHFFKACKMEREYFKKISMKVFGSVEQYLGKKTVH